TTNEELQSTIEELETTNEELQSTNEELETMNEELQSTNEELETLNEELERRTAELNELNAYMSSILTSLHVAVVVVDREMGVRVWNRQAEELWGLRADEVTGQAFLNLDIGLPVERLKAAVRAILDGRSEAGETVLECVNRRGRGMPCRVTSTPLLGPDREVRGAVLLMEERAGAETP
ncbi:MAG TPA: PAS domain-containing protein, partial [Longimicrobiaceae bacterium]